MAGIFKKQIWEWILTRVIVYQMSDRREGVSLLWVWTRESIVLRRHGSVNSYLSLNSNPPQLPKERKMVVNICTFYFTSLMPPLPYPQTWDKWNKKVRKKRTNMSWKEGQTQMHREGSLTLIQSQMLISVHHTDSRDVVHTEGERMKDVMSERISGLDTTRCPLSSIFLFTWQLSPPLPQHCQSLAVTHLHFADWLSCLSSSGSDKWV